jgi:hypothetical protein
MTSVLHNQRVLAERWLQSDEAMRIAGRLVRSRRMHRSPEEIISEAWLRIERHFGNRSRPLSDFGDEVVVSRYMYRVLDNVSRDLIRSDIRKIGARLVEDPAVPSHADAVESRVILEHLIWAVGQEATAPRRCDGCSDAIVVSAALTVLHLLLEDQGGELRGRATLDRLITDALKFATHDALSEAAIRQRKSRCSDCIVELLQDGLRRTGLVHA